MMTKKVIVLAGFIVLFAAALTPFSAETTAEEGEAPREKTSPAAANPTAADMEGMTKAEVIEMTKAQMISEIKQIVGSYAQVAFLIPELVIEHPEDGPPIYLYKREDGETIPLEDADKEEILSILSMARDHATRLHAIETQRQMNMLQTLHQMMQNTVRQIRQNYQPPRPPNVPRAPQAPPAIPQPPRIPPPPPQQRR